MKTKIALAVSAALMSSLLTGNIHAQEVRITQLSKSAADLDNIPASTTKQAAAQEQTVFMPEAGLDGQAYRYIVRLEDSPVALYEGNIAGYPATTTKSAGEKLDVTSQKVVNYRSFLRNKQNDVLKLAQASIGKLDIKQQTTLAYNGMVIKMTQEQAKKLAKVPGVAHIYRETLRYPNTDSGPAIIKAPAIWNGTLPNTQSKGEGMIVGIIDTGVNTDHPSFADVGGDGYDHTNPWGPGVYSGDCAGDFPQLCNDKLIGVHSWPEVTDEYADYDPDVPANGEDHNGHGSHTASTTAGNVLINQNVPDVDNKDSGVVFEHVSGVAPHANIVSYQVCRPGERDAIAFNGCLPSLTVLAVEHAIENGVDALNYSIGGGTSNPWNDADAQAFLAARKAGIHVATSAGNDGPDPQTVGSPGDAPWITTVAAYTHDRDFSDKTISDFTGGDTTAPEALTGKAMTGGISGPIVYAGDFENANDPGNDPAQCLEPFPENTFAAGTIVVCDRGVIARVDKGRHVQAGGAAGLVLANLQGEATSVVADAHVIPAIHIDADQGDVLRTWLASGEGHTATIGGTEVIHDAALAKIAADFTSRGPNGSVPDVIVPSVAAPGVRIFAAYANDQSAGFKEFPDPSDFGFLSGTSMASPHVAGALTLLAATRPDWSPAEVQSALMLTADQNTFKEDGKTPSDFFDMGAGFINIEAAAQSSLVLDENYLGYQKGNPAQGGKPSQINLASMANASCVGSCSWTRTVKATQDGTWVVVPMGAADGFKLDVKPSHFELKAGETQELQITADITLADAGWHFANIGLVAENTPMLKMPVAVKGGGDNLPESFEIVASRNSGSLTLPGYTVKALGTVTKVGAYDKSADVAGPFTLEVPDGSLDYVALDIPALSNIVFSISSETAPDVDLRILNSSFRRIGASAGPDSNEQVAFTNFAAGTYYIVVDAYTPSAPGATDEVTLRITSIDPIEENLADNLAVSVSQQKDAFDLTFNWSSAENAAGVVVIEGENGNSKTVAYTLTRGDDDVEVMTDALAEDMVPGKAVKLGFTLQPNLSVSDKTYTLTATLPPGHEVSEISHGGIMSGNKIFWSVEQPAKASDSIAADTSGDPTEVTFKLTPRLPGDAMELSLSHSTNSDTVESTHTFGVQEAAPEVVITGPKGAYVGEAVTLDASDSSDANKDELEFTWKQLSGAQANFTAKGATMSFSSPSVTSDAKMVFEVTVSDGKSNPVSASYEFTAKPQPVQVVDNGGGSLGWLTVLLLPLAALRRKWK
ncbi:S8 family serine peptidase [Shewanella sp. GXUN23E]|uniref:S8 family serine peptidase n=1 Tax=Shewanella sp. GXUN23E TaxID=3422498 RepID=UPI003D7DFAC8